MPLAKKKEQSEKYLLKPKAPVRQSNLELLRILLMLMIVGHHIRAYGDLGGLPSAPLSRLVLFLLTVGGKVAVDGFVLLSGYFMCTSTKIGVQPKRLLKFWLQVFFYSAGGLLVLILLGRTTFMPVNLVTFFLPVSQNVYWFATTYFFLMLLSPFLNRLAQSLSRRDYRLLLLISGILISVVPTLLRVKYPVPNMVLFLFLYMLAGYLRLHPEPLFERKWLALGVAAGSYLFIVGHALVYGRLVEKLPLLRFLPAQMYTPGNSVPALLCALGLFFFFKNLKMKGSRVINLIASASFGVYLLHEHSMRARDLIWKELFNVRPSFGQPLLLAGHILLAIFIIFAVGIVIDLIRQYALEKPLFWGIDKLEEKWKRRRRDGEEA